MELFDCAIGQRVLHRETGKLATIKQLWRAQGEVEIEFANGQRTRVNPKTLTPAGSPADAAPRAPSRPCPQCGAELDATQACVQCGFAYRATAPRRFPLAHTLLISVVVMAAIAFVAWKFLLPAGE